MALRCARGDRGDVADPAGPPHVTLTELGGVVAWFDPLRAMRHGRAAGRGRAWTPASLDEADEILEARGIRTELAYEREMAPALMSWVETESPNFTARHEERDADDVVELLEPARGHAGANGRGLPVDARARRRRHPRLERGAGARAAVHPDRAPAHRARGPALPRRLVRPRHGARARPAHPARARVQRPGLGGDGAARAGRAVRAARRGPQQPAAPSPVPARAASSATCAGPGCPTAPRSGSAGRRPTRAPRSRGACARARSRASRPACATRSCSAARSST